MLLLLRALIECAQASQLLRQAVLELKQPLLVLPTCQWAITNCDKSVAKCKNTDATAGGTYKRLGESATGTSCMSLTQRRLLRAYGTCIMQCNLTNTQDVYSCCLAIGMMLLKQSLGVIA